MNSVVDDVPSQVMRAVEALLEGNPVLARQELLGIDVAALTEGRDEAKREAW